MTRRPEMTKPEDVTVQVWLSRLETERHELLAQARREVHTRGNSHQAHFDRLDRAIAKARKEIAS